MPLNLYPPKRTPYWIVRGTVGGKSIYASTKARDKASARRFAIELEIKILAEAGKPSRAATFREAAELYLNFRRPKKPERVAIERLCDVIGDTLLSDVRQHTLVSATSKLLRHDLSPSTKNRQVLTPASSILHYAAENDLCPYIKVRKFKEKNPEPRAVTKDVAAALIAAAEGKMRTLIIFLFCQGWRISDVLKVQWQHIDFEAATIKYHVSKTDEWLVMPLHLRVLAALREGRTDFGRVFPWGNKANVYRELRPLCAKIRVHFTPHMARHSFATWLAAEGVSTKEIMEAGAWKDHKSVMRYTKVDEKRVRSVINKIKA